MAGGWRSSGQQDRALSASSSPMRQSGSPVLYRLAGFL
jgi:hypothetical protein